MTSLKTAFVRSKMPIFAIYSKLRADLLKCMLIKATEFEDFEIPALREMFGVMKLFPLDESSRSLS